MSDILEPYKELASYEEMWIVDGIVLAFKTFPSQDQINKIREILDGIEETNKEFPIAI